MQAQSIDQVIDFLEIIIQECIENESSLGYFAALYQKVTKRVKERIGTGYFDDDKRMEQLDVQFANRYLEAYSQLKLQQLPTRSWMVTFEAAENKNLIVLQHLLLGMNAHINLDLGIAAAEVAQNNMLDLKDDFNKINELLGKLLDEVQRDLVQIWPFLRYLLSLAKNLDNILVNFSMEMARKGAWTFALELAHCKEDKKEAIDLRDQKIADLSKIINRRKGLVKWVFRIIRFAEKGTVRSRIGHLQS